MVRKLMLGLCLAAVALIPSTAFASSIPNAPAGAPKALPAQSAPAACPSSVSTTAPNVVAASDSGASNFFAPKTITIPVGQSIIFDNTGQSAHTATADPSSGTWDSGPLLPGQCWTTPVFTTPGTYTYHCTYHQSLGMVGSITVGAGGPAAAGATPTPAATPSASASPSPTGPPLSGLPTPQPPPTAPPSQKYFPKIGGALVVLLVIAVLVGYYKTTKKLADKG
jgi:plastocyanin